MSLQDVLYKLSKIESAVDNINLRLCSLENNLNSNSNRPLRSFNQRIPRNIFYSSRAHFRRAHLKGVFSEQELLKIIRIRTFRPTRSYAKYFQKFLF